jgi:hypothetical protein
MIWYPPYYEDPDPEEEAKEMAEYPQLLFEALEEAAEKYPDHIDVHVHVPGKRDIHTPGEREAHIPGEREVHIPGERGVHIPGETGVHKRGISESTPGLEREVEGERGRAAPAVPNDAERGDSEVPSVSRYGRQRRVKRRE